MLRPCLALLALSATSCLFAPPALAQQASRQPYRTALAASSWWKGSEISYLPGIGPAAKSQSLLLAQGNDLALTSWFHLGGQTAVGYQLTPSEPGAGGWVSSLGGIVPRLGYQTGPFRIDVGALLGLGAMLRTTRVAGVDDVAQLRGFWLAEPRLEVGVAAEGVAASLFGGYAFSPNPADLGGVVFGLDFRFQNPGAAGGLPSLSNP